MPEERDFPFEAARDLLGLFRAIFVAEKRRAFPSATKLELLSRLAQQLHDAATLAATHDPGTAPYEKALSLAEGVVLRLSDVITLTDPVLPVLEAAASRVKPAKRRKKEFPPWAMGRRSGGG